MAFCTVNWFSATLRKQVAMNVILPETGTPPFPVFYLLHGLSDDYSVWQRRTRIEWYVRDLPLVVVMPEGLRGFYTDNNCGPAYARYLAEDVPAFVERHFGGAPAREGRCIGGLSMGGYGALRLALGWPERYISATSHSGALLIGSGPVASERFDSGELERIFGTNPTGSEHDLIMLAERAARQGIVPALRLDCGTADFLLESNRHYHHELVRLGVAHEYAEHPGNHNWDFWDARIQEALRFHCRALGLDAA